MVMKQGMALCGGWIGLYQKNIFLVIRIDCMAVDSLFYDVHFMYYTNQSNDK